MNFIKRFKGILIALGIAIIILTICFHLPEQTNETISENEDVPVSVETTESAIKEREKTKEPTNNEIKKTSVPTPVSSLETKEPADALEERSSLSCTLTVRCDTIINNMESIAPEKMQLVPENGIILPEAELKFSEGDTVFDVLEKELKDRKIHFEFSKVSMYDSVYIEGIGNLYEFDAGNLSGWIYRVNGKVPPVGCSQYELKNGDKIEVLYTCNMGRDL